MTKYVNDNGVSEMWTNTKNYISAQLLGKSDVGHTHSASDITSGLATVATSGSYNDLSNKPTIPTVNNATLTIQKNGTNVQTFTANQSTNATANITVPTKTSDLTNDSGFITEDTTKIPLAGSNQISGSLIPATNGTVNLGSSTNKWKSINGIAPDELGLPTSTYTDVSSYIINFDYTANTFTAPVSGMLYVDGGGGNVLLENATLGYTVNFNLNLQFNNCRAIMFISQGEIINVYCNYVFFTRARIYHLKGKV